MICDMKDCKKEAEFRIQSEGQIADVCSEHCDELQNIQHQNNLSFRIIASHKIIERPK